MESTRAPATNGEAHPGDALATLTAGEVVTVHVRGEFVESWTGEVRSADTIAIRLRATRSRMGPIVSAETGELLIPWRRVDWVDLERPASGSPAEDDKRTQAVRQTVSGRSTRQLLNSVDRFQVEMDEARAQGDLQAHLQASTCWNLVWDELDRRDLPMNETIA